MTEKRTGLIVTSSAKAPALRSSESDRIVTRGGALARTVDKVPLRMSKKELFTLDRGKTFTITAEGFRTLNAASGMTIVDAPTVVVDGIEQPNPCVKKDDATGKITDVWIRKGIVGRSTNGNVLVLTQTIHYSPRLYFLRDLFNLVKMGQRWRKNPSTGKNEKVSDTDWSEHGRLVPIARLDSIELADHEAVYPLDETVAIVANLMSSDVAAVIATQNENQIFAVRKAATICERRLCQAHPGFPRQTIQGIGNDAVTITWDDPGSKYAKPVEAVAYLDVMGWVENADAQREALRAAAQFEAGESSLDAHLVDLGEVSSSTVEEPVEKVVDVQATVTTKEEETTSADVVDDGPRLKLIEQGREMAEELKRRQGGEEKVRALSRELLGPLAFEDNDEDSLRAFISAVSCAIDADDEGQGALFGGGDHED